VRGIGAQLLAARIDDEIELLERDLADERGVAGGYGASR
jgi:hypothetical protein